MLKQKRNSEMESEDEIIFCQDDFMSKSFEVFEDMRRKEELVDFKINLENRSVIGHRLVLAARIPQFREIFCSAEAKLPLEEVDPDVIESVIDFAYSGKIKITPGNVVPLISVSKALQLPQMYEVCWEYLKTRLHSDNLLQFRKLAEDHGYSKFLEASDNYIRQCFEEFSNSESFVDLSLQQLKEVIRRDDIKVNTEEKVFEAVMRWVKSSETERRDLLPELLRYVRMYFITPDYLIERVSTEELVRSSLLCRDLVEDAKSYHLLPDKRSKFFHVPPQPRFYQKKAVSPPVSSQPGHRDMHHLSAVAVLRRSFIYNVFGSVSNWVINIKQFDAEGERWHHVASHKKCYYPDAVVSLGEVIYIFAGLVLYTFELSTKKLSSLRCENTCGSGIVAYKSNIYFFGGDISSDKVRCFNLKQKKLLEECPVRRKLSWPGVTLLSSSGGNSSKSETFIYITGGILAGNAIYSNVDRYNPETKEWSNVSPMLHKRWRHSCCDLKQKIYVCGGMTDNYKILSSAEMFDPLTNQWNVITPMKEALYSLSVTSHENKLYVLSNQSFSSMQHRLQIYDPITNEWKISARACRDEGGAISGIFLVKLYDVQS